MSVEINVISVETDYVDIIKLTDYERLITLIKIAKVCKIPTESMLAFYDMLYEYKPPPNISSVKEILLNYILQDSHYVPYIILDIHSKAKQPWEYYVPKDPPKNTIRLTLLYRKKVMVDNGITILPLIMPKGQVIDIKNINQKNLNLIKSMFLSVIFHNSQHTHFSITKLHTFPEYSLDIHPVHFDKTIEDFISLISDVTNIYPKIFYSPYQFVAINAFNNISNNLIEFLGTQNEISASFIHDLKSKKDYILRSIVNSKNKAKEVIKDYIIKDNIRIYFINTYNKYRSVINTIDYMFVLNNMKNEDKNYVLNEYNRLIEFKTSTRANKCPHLELVKNFRHKQNIIDKKYFYEKLEQFIANPEEEKKWHTCRRCKFNIICPHIRISWQMIFKNEPALDIRHRLDWYRGKYDKSQYQDFCKICHELLFDANYEEIEGETYKIIYKAVFKYLWSQVLNLFPSLNFSPKVNIFDFGSIVVYGILPLITRSKNPEVINQMNRYLESSEEHLDIELKGYIILYVYAYILNMIRFNNSNPEHKNVQITFNDESKGTNISNYADVVIKRLVTMHRSTFAQLTTINLGETLITIYTELAKSDSIFTLKRVNNLELIIFDEIIYTTIFNYSFNIATLTDYIDVTILTDTDLVQYEKMVQNILGMNISDIAKGTKSNNYLKVYQPNYNDPSTNLYLDIMKTDKITLEDITKMGRGRTIYSFKVYMERFEKVSKETYIVDDDTLLNAILAMEKKIKAKAFIFYRFITSILQATIGWKERIYTDDNKLTAVLNEKGQYYKWDILVYNDGTEILKGTGEGIKSYLQIVNYKDVETGILKTETHKNNLEQTIKSYAMINRKKIFFHFYMVKCPKKGIHDWDKIQQKFICSKCKLVEGEKTEDYYKKYYSCYIIENKEATENRESIFTEVILSNKKEIKNITWTYNERSIIELSNMINQPRFVLESIGAMEGRTVKEVQNNIKRPDLPDSFYDPQLMLALSHYYWIVRHYNRTKYSQLNTDLLLEHLFKKENITSNDIIGVKKDMPEDLFDNYNNIILYLFKNDSISYSDKYKGIIQMISELILSIHGINIVLSKIAKGFIGYIIKNEFYTTLSNGNFDRSLFRKIDSNIIGPVENDNFDIDNLDDSKIDAEGILDYEDVDIIHNT